MRWQIRCCKLGHLLTLQPLRIFSLCVGHVSAQPGDAAARAKGEETASLSILRVQVRYVNLLRGRG